MKLKGKTILITGAGRGIGNGIALAAAEEGMKILIADKNKDELEETKKW